MPVPYDDTGNGQFRPAHFHLLISAPGYQSLVTQLYFTGDPYLTTDVYAASSKAKQRVLTVKPTANNRKLVSFDVTMTENLLAEPAAIDRLAGTYLDEKDRNLKTEFFKRDGQLWRKSGRVVYGINYEYIGNNTFAQSGLPPGLIRTYLFEPQADGSVKVTSTNIDAKGNKVVTVSFKKP
ncbi:hypothetical protein GCM10023189_24100 [Nibrella saemangeumensis]|uniref:Intradiol ring-cleavage dioxygenases domain-containing protein n=2 Tax=Nibrella saemangeumensis TaxID=1084526 RepID=A0ABP8MXI1_9BACT